MATFEENLQEWIVNETNIVTETRLEKIPKVITLSLLTEGKNKKIWEYILTHIRSKHSAEKVRRVLKLKRDQTNPEKLFPKPINDFSKLHQHIKNAEDKQIFLRSSVSNIKEEVVSTEQALRDIYHEIDMIHQKIAILHLITLHYQEKTALLNSLHGRLSLHLINGVFKPNANFFPLNVRASAKKSSLAIPDEINPRIKHLLSQTESLVVKKFQNFTGISPFIFTFQMSAAEVFKGVFMCDLLCILKEQTKISSMNMIKILSQDQRVDSPKDLQKRDSEKLLQELKFNHLNINFSVKKIKNYICRLKSEKESLLMSKTNPFIEDTEYQTKCQLLDKIAENVGLGESINFLEEMLCNEQTNVNNLNKINAMEFILNDDIVAIKNKFYNDFDTMCLMQISVPSMLDYIVKRYIDIHKYANEELFLIMSSVLQEFPREVKIELKSKDESLWKVLRKNDVIKPLLQGTQTIEQSVPVAFYNLVDVAPFQNLTEVCQNIKLFKDFISSNKNDYWDYDDKRQLNVYKQYEIMMNMLQEMKNALNVCEGNLENSLNYRNSIQTAQQDWWEQGAQFIPDIEYDNKTLKMWIDIIKVADNAV